MQARPFPSIWEDLWLKEGGVLFSPPAFRVQGYTGDRALAEVGPGISTSLCYWTVTWETAPPSPILLSSSLSSKSFTAFIHCCHSYFPQWARPLWNLTVNCLSAGFVLPWDLFLPSLCPYTTLTLHPGLATWAVSIPVG
jgi:hypothetical protein